MTRTHDATRPRLAALALGAAGLLCAPASAQLELDYADGRLGSEIVYGLQGGANEFVLLLPSALPGPTPLSIVEPLDPRFMSVGLDQLSLLAIVWLGPTGTAEVTYPLPLVPAIVGAEVYAQAVSLGTTIPSSPFFGDLSNPTRFTLLLSGQSTLAKEPLTAPRRFHTASPIPGGPIDSERVLMVGGELPFAPFAIRQDWEIVDPSTEKVVQSGPLLERRTRHAAVELADGRVLLIGGLGGASGGALATVEMYLPNLDAVVAVQPMNHARVGHTATLLPNGRVLVVGGFGGPYTQDHPLGFPAAFFGSGGSPTSFAPSAEVFDPTTNTWTLVPSIGPRVGHDAQLLGDGTVVIAGGVVPGPFTTPVDTNSCLRFFPTTQVATAAAPLPGPRAYVSLSPEATGGALLSGGGPIALSGGQVTVGALGQSTLRFDPVLGTWSAVASEPSTVALVKVKCVRMPDGSIQYIRIECPDGRIDPVGAGTAAPAVHVLVPGSGVWSLDGFLLERRPGFTATNLDARTRFVIGGSAENPIPGGTGTPDRTLESYPYRL
jgi:hypothetical protein